MSKKDTMNYFDGFIACAKCAQAASVLLAETLNSFDPETVADRMNELHKLEHEADDITHTISDRLIKEFLPPIDRDDIMLLSQQLDDVVDAIDDILREISMYQLKTMRPEVCGLCELLNRGCIALCEMMEEMKIFKKSKTIHDKIVLINTLESNGDTLHYNAVRSLFSGNDSALDVMIWKNIFDEFENCFDSLEHISDSVRRIVLKNS